MLSKIILNYLTKLHITFFIPVSRCYLICVARIYFLFQVSIVVSDSCPVSRSTVQAVDDCPESEEKWKEAAAKKNCAAYAKQCDKAERLEYHCVINSFVNQTIEVCAYSRIIVLGRF